jgi:hypothetical protein
MSIYGKKIELHLSAPLRCTVLREKKKLHTQIATSQKMEEIAERLKRR